MTTRKSLPEPTHFVPYTQEIERKMLDVIGVSTFNDLLESIPSNLKNGSFPLDSSKSELQVTRELTNLSKKNLTGEELISFVGGGAYDHFIPEAVSALTSRSEFATSYTPYQAEVSQGTLQSIFEFQTMICDITGMEVANASLYDGASAVAEACLLANRVNNGSVVLLSEGLFDNYIRVTNTYLQNSHIDVEIIPAKNGFLDFNWLKNRLNDNVSAVVIQSPNRFGLIESGHEVGKLISEYPTLFVVSGNPLSYGLFASPGEWDADIYAGEGQVFGSPVSFGGPYLGLFAGKMKYVRKMPGRLVASAKDVDGKPGFVLALQTREQHIRRERATSNICTNQGLVALAAAIYLSLMGKEGFKKVANLCFNKAHYLANEVSNLSGFHLPFGERFFNEFVVKCPVEPQKILNDGLKQGVLAGTVPNFSEGSCGRDDPNFLRIAVTEKRTKEDMDQFITFLKGYSN